MLEKQYNYAVTISWYFLKPIGIWSISKDAFWCYRLNMLIVLLSYWFVIFMVLLCVLHVQLADPNVDAKMELFGLISFSVVSVAKYTLLVQKTVKISECFQHVKLDWQNSCLAEKKVIFKYAKLNSFLSLLSAFFMYSGGFFYHILMPIMGVNVFSLFDDIFSASDGTASTRLSIAAVHKFWPYLKVDLVCRGMYLLQCMSGYILDTITISTCSITAVFISHISAQLEIVMMQLKHYVKGETGFQDIPFPTYVMTTEARLTFIVLRHIRALKFAAHVEECLRGICFIEFIGSTINICFIGFYFGTEWREQEPISILTYSILLISFTVNIFIFCYIGELLTSQSINVGSIYQMVDWYNLPAKKATDLMFIMMISQYPIKLTAGKFVDLTLSTFTNVIKTAFAYWSLMRTVVMKLKN